MECNEIVLSSDLVGEGLSVISLIGGLPGLTTHHSPKVLKSAVELKSPHEPLG